MPDIPDADLEHARPTPEAAQATLQAAQVSFQAVQALQADEATLQAAQALRPDSPSACKDPSLDATDVFSDVAVAYYVKPADRSRISDALKKETIAYTKLSSDPKHDRGLSNALICGADTPVKAIKKIALALINAGVDIKYIGTKYYKI
jgi:hypothetical protein